MIADAPPKLFTTVLIAGLFWGSEPKFLLFSKEWSSLTQSTTFGQTSASSAEAKGSSNIGVTLASFWFDLAQRELTKWIQSSFNKAIRQSDQ